MTNNVDQSAFFESLHNLLWNDAGLDPQKALEHMTFFFAYRLIEPQVDILGLPECCKWSYMANQGDTQKIFDVMKKAVNEFRKNTQTKPYFNPPSINKATLIQRIIEKINELDIEALRGTDTLGNIFEYMLGRGMSTMSDEGQYFTNRKICSLAFELAYEIKKSVRRDDGTLCTFGDFFCGTGGFASAYVNGVKKVDPNVNWQKDKESIYCLDKNLSSVQTTLLNMLITTGVPFNINKIKEHNSFQNNIVHQGLDTAGFFDVEFDFLFMNPPYGGDKSKGKEYRFKYTNGKGKDRQYVVNKEIQTIGIEDDDKVSAGVQLAMALLSRKGGVCCIVLPQVFFFGSSKKQIELRKRLVEEYDVLYVVDIASGEFANTGTKTCMLVFQASKRHTSEIHFMNINQEIITKATYEMLTEKHYTMNMNAFIESINLKQIPKEFTLVRIGDILEFQKKTMKLTAKDGKVSGKYSFYSCAGKQLFYDEYEFDKMCLIVNRGGDAKVRIDSKFAISHDDIHVLSFNNKTSFECTVQYIGYHLLANPHILNDQMNGTTIRHLNKTTLEDIKIPLPPLELQKQIVEPIDAWIGMAQAEEKLVEQLEKAVMSNIRVMSMAAPNKKLGDYIQTLNGYAFKSQDYVQHEDSWSIIKITNLNNGTVTKVDQCDRVVYCEKYKKFVIHKFDCLVGLTGLTKNKILGRYFDDLPVLMNQRVCKLEVGKDSACIIDYIYYYLLLNEDKIINLGTGTCQKNVSSSMLLEMNVCIPNIEEQQTLQFAFDEIKNKREKISLYKQKSKEYIDKTIPKC
jgi:type I restriction-modification system DNA methylase subunit